MGYFLRFTNTANEDFQRGTSIHASDLSVSEFTKEQAAEIFSVDAEQIGEYNGTWCQILDGICGYSLNAETLEEAIEEVQENNYQFDFVGKAVIFEGRYSQDSDLVPDGDLFVPWSIAIEL